MNEKTKRFFRIVYMIVNYLITWPIRLIVGLITLLGCCMGALLSKDSSWLVEWIDGLMIGMGVTKTFVKYGHEIAITLYDEVFLN